MTNKFCGPDIVKYFVVVCSGTTFLQTISGCTDSVNLNNTIFYNSGEVFFNSVITACTGINTSNIHSCSPLNINPNDEGNVYFGSTSGVTIDVSSGNISANLFTGDGSGLYNLSVSNTFVTGFTYNDANTFTISRNGGLSDLTTSINNVTGFTVNGDLVISGNTNISETPQIDTNPVLQLLTRDSSSGDVKIKPVPNTLNYGLFSQTGDSVTIVNTDVETSIIGGGIGTLSVPINGFQIGDSFESKMYGLLSNGGGQDIRIKLKSGSIILADSLMQNLVVHSDDVFTLEVNFTIRNIGSAGTAEIITIGTFQATKKNSNNVFGFSFETINNTTFDTTISNTLGITIEWDNASNNNSIKSQLFTLKKVY